MKEKIGKIVFRRKNEQNAIRKEQYAIADDIINLLSSNGVDVIVDYDLCTIDINVTVAEIIKPFEVLGYGIFRVFWSSNNDFKIGYLCAGKGYFDGYEIHRKWSKDLALDDILLVLNEDISRVNKLLKT